MSVEKFRIFNKLLIIPVLYIAICAFSVNRTNLIASNSFRMTGDTIPEIVVSTNKTEGYKIYLNHCNELVIDTILQSGYLDFDTLRVVSIPANQLYFGKMIIKSLQISKDLANIIVQDTIWNAIEAPEYRSTYDYYVLAAYPMPEPKKIEIDYTNKIIVFRPRVYTLKRSKPLPYNDWDRFINNKPTRTSTTEQYF